ncbi:MMPL family transporter [Streptomyces sp. JJ36]|uniref:MMPL family transporter n=1 Tax=Streptomyces sp. JJ36 TaxID=2736645 RepID=UPI001F02D2AC|nr:MMPL family transporter [Streptomyces sp. JJ36]MCF6524522.1 MMPL family transporter [Streptomyces sp. JJ36]
MPRTPRRLLPVALLLLWVAVGGLFGPYPGKLSEVATNEQSAFLPQNAESTRVLDAQERLRTDEGIPAIVVWTADDGSVSAQQRQAATTALSGVTDEPAVQGEASPAVPSEDREAMRGVVQLDSAVGERVGEVVGTLREAAGTVPDTTVHIAGPAATQADLTDAFAGIDGLLLSVALGVVLLILLLVYRSVLLPLTVILAAVLALALATAVVYTLADHDVLRVDGQVQGILFILVIGAATDYALLISARFKEELAGHGDRFAAMTAALRRSFGAVVASGATVGLGLLALLLSDLSNNRALGPVGAIGIVCAMLSALTFLPAALTLLGRAAYWPARPKETTGPTDPGTRGRGVWPRVAGAVDRAPRRIWAGTLVVLAACSALATGLNAQGVPLSETFINDTPSVSAQQVLDEHFPGSSGNPAVIVTDADRLREVTRVARTTEGVADAAPVTASGRPGGAPLTEDGQALVRATPTAAADSEAAMETVQRLRDGVHAVPGADALVGGYTAQQYDIQQAAERDRQIIPPVVLAIILVILVVLLRALLLPLLLVATVALNFTATVGVAALAFEHVFGFSGTDPSVPLYGFVFLVALGVDYNIFLMTRVREEARRSGTRRGVLTGLSATGGVITSAGVVLAATFAALAVLPLAFLVQIAFIVAFGVLLDTLVVRSLLVPALVRDIGPQVWWPGALRRSAD